MKYTRCFVGTLLLVSWGGVGCAHGHQRGPECGELPRDGGVWQVDRVEPPWGVLLGPDGETRHISTYCFPRVKEGMSFRDGLRDHAYEKVLADRVRESLRRAFGHSRAGKIEVVLGRAAASKVQSLQETPGYR